MGESEVFYDQDAIIQIFDRYIRNVDNNQYSVSRTATYAIIVYEKLDIFLDRLQEAFDSPSISTTRRSTYFSILVQVLFRLNETHQSFVPSILKYFELFALKLVTAGGEPTAKMVRSLVTEIIEKNVASPEWCQNFDNKIESSLSRSNPSVSRATSDFISLVQQLAPLKKERQAFMRKSATQTEMKGVVKKEIDLRRSLAQFHTEQISLEEEALSKLPDPNKLQGPSGVLSQTTLDMIESGSEGEGDDELDLL